MDVHIDGWNWSQKCSLVAGARVHGCRSFILRHILGGVGALRCIGIRLFDMCRAADRLPLMNTSKAFLRTQRRYWQSALIGVTGFRLMVWLIPAVAAAITQVALAQFDMENNCGYAPFQMTRWKVCTPSQCIKAFHCAPGTSMQIYAKSAGGERMTREQNM